jgi:hypothetical protein
MITLFHVIFDLICLKRKIRQIWMSNFEMLQHVLFYEENTFGKLLAKYMHI